MDSKQFSLEERVARLEGALWVATHGALSQPLGIAAVVLSAFGLYLLYRGLGLPNHVYQPGLACVAVLLAYHRGWLSRTRGWLQGVLAVLNFAQLAFLLKLFIGCGKRMPLFWIKYPIISKSPTEGGWLQTAIGWTFAWEPTPLANWQLDLTVVQTFLLIVTLVGALFRFQPFVSLTAFALVLVSIPALASFQWDWVLPALLISGLALYLQTPSPLRKYRG